MSIILQTEDLKKSYLIKQVLHGISMQVESGRILGLLGPNGSGKTTFLKIIAGLLKPSSGSVQVCGIPLGLETKKMVSFLADKNCLYSWMTALDAINFYADFFEDFDKNKALDMLHFMKLEKSQPVKTMSKGMTEKLNLTLSFSRNARLFIIDEPLAGTDPVAREQIIKTIIKTWSENSAIIISTHLVSDIEHVFNDVIFLSEGEIVLSGDAEQLRVSREKSIYQLYIEIFDV
ncbi:ABC transporter, ATP-binding protein [Treponema phagedenis F0421]|uniref:ABC transporter ATP-binding protein n=1 Tax=Treponema phagedenis TaxID=162 RepID=UPI0001F63C63|nr:ABC transporter ATP-binding protein [Treponema phagedenis]EFW37956.1 ABC transporter, ATP-binding protein [Treponema phagedenis F0421]